MERARANGTCRRSPTPAPCCRDGSWRTRYNRKQCRLEPPWPAADAGGAGWSLTRRVGPSGIWQCRHPRLWGSGQPTGRWGPRGTGREGGPRPRACGLPDLPRLETETAARHGPRHCPPSLLSRPLSPFSFQRVHSEARDEQVWCIRFGENARNHMTRAPSEMADPRGVAHGGSIATVLDLCTANLGSVYAGVGAPTQDIAVRFRRPLPVPGTYVVRTRLEALVQEPGRRARFRVSGQLTSRPAAEGDATVVYAEAETTCVGPKGVMPPKPWHKPAPPAGAGSAVRARI